MGGETTWGLMVEAWAALVRMGANLPGHPLHAGDYARVYKWISDNEAAHWGKGARNVEV